MQPIIDKMNDMIQLYHDKSRPEYCAKVGMVDEIVDMTELRPYIQAFTELFTRIRRASADAPDGNTPCDPRVERRA